MILSTKFAIPVRELNGSAGQSLLDIIDITGVRGGTVYPALRRLEDAGYLTSEWEEQSVAQSEPRPARKYYELTREGRELLGEAIKRYRLSEQTQPKKERVTKPSQA